MSIVTCVTGGTGFLGRRLVRLLLKQGHQVRCLVRESSDTSVLKELQEKFKSSLRLQRGSLDKRSDVREFLDGGQVLYHVAAALGGSTSTMFLNTVVPTRTLIDASLEAGISRFVLVSSLGVYGTSTLSTHATLDEHCPVDPHGELRDPYTFSKIRQEQVAWEAFRERDLPLVVVRPGVIYGPGRSPVTSRVGLKLGGVLLKMGGSQQLPYTHVDNCAEAIALAGFAEGVDGEAINIVDDNLPSGSRILKMLNQLGRRQRSLWVPRLLIQPLSGAYELYSRWSEGQLPPVITRYKSQAIWKSLKYSNEKARQRLSWTPKISIADGLRETIQNTPTA